MLKTLFNKKNNQGIKSLGTIGGHKVRYFLSVADMPKSRFLYLLTKTEELGNAFTKVDVQVAMDLILEQANKLSDDPTDIENAVDIAQAIKNLCNHVQAKSEQYSTSTLMYELGGIGILIDDEDPNSFDDQYIEIKRKLLQEHGRDFFPCVVCNCLRYIEELRSDVDAEKMRNLAISDYKKRYANKDVLFELIHNSVGNKLWSDPIRQQLF